MSDDWMIPKEVAHELANLRALLAQAEAREAELQVQIAALKKELGWTRMK